MNGHDELSHPHDDLSSGIVVAGLTILSAAFAIGFFFGLAIGWAP
jgi:hypothetical protein